MSRTRRNEISRDADVAVAVIAALAVVVAVLSEASPTGGTVTDVVLVGACAALVTWLGASAPWWALLAGSAIAFVGALSGPSGLIAAAAVAVAASAWIGWDRANLPVVRAGIAGVVVQVALRLDGDEFFLSSALVGGAAMGVIGVAGLKRRRKRVRRSIAWGLAGLAVLAVLGVGGLAIAGARSADTARDGYVGLLDGLEFVQNGDVADARAALEQAAVDLDDAQGTLAGPLTQLARLVPGVAQNRNVGVEVLADAADAADAAATSLQFVDLEQLTVSNGRVDVDALAILEQPLAELAGTVSALRDTLVDAESEWLVAPLRDRLDTGVRRAEQAAHQATATAAAARVGPAVLGADEPRRYLLAFVNNAEARGTSGLMGNWNEVTIDDGQLAVTASGRTNDLEDLALYDFDLDVDDNYLARYAPYGAGYNGGTAVKYWSNVTVPADMASVGSVMAQMYEAVTDRALDGVFVIDPAGVAGLLDITGPVELADIGQRITGANAQEFLTVGQYEFAENEREDLLTAVTDATVDNVLGSTLPPPQQMAPALAPAVLNGHISGWAARPDEQELFELVGMDASLPVVEASGTDALAVVNINRNPNKIDSFLQRTVEYRPVVDQRTGDASATLVVSLTNTAPRTGFEPYVIGNRVGLPSGTNRSIIDVYTQLPPRAVRVDGAEVSPATLSELGYNVHSTMVEIPPGGTVVVEFELAGNLGPGPYELVYRPQPLPAPETLTVDARTSGGEQIFAFDDVIERRSVLSADGVRAWR